MSFARRANYAIIDADDKPAHLPGPDAIIEACIAYNNVNVNNTYYLRGMPLVDKAGTAYAWVKFGGSIAMAGARTMDYVAGKVNGTPAAIAAHVRIPRVYLAFLDTRNWGYIVMEFIAGAICSRTDVPAVAKAVEFLTTVQGPSKQPGPIGGGPIFHSFFNDRESSLEYPSVKDLQDHINRMLGLWGVRQRVDFAQEVEAHGLRLCPSNMNRRNFIKEDNGTIVALDFGEACFLPVSFFHLALRGHDSYTSRLRNQISHEPSAQLGGLLIAQGILVQTGNNKFDSDQVTGSFDEPDVWEQEIGLDEVIGRPPPGARHSFEVTGMDGIDLKAPTLLDLLSDEPVQGAIGTTASPEARKDLSAG
ncbi:hypothetical protein FRC11_006320 [Ceratobasidium sp. 423]|nr:hypothetical protein FRC11_006320 [Ceratobasidium sp. 423]